MTRKQAFFYLSEELQNMNVENYMFEVREFIFSLFSVNYLEYLQSEDVVLSEEETEKVYGFVEKRKKGYPLAYIIGEWDFYGETYKVGEGVLIPRSDTETLIDKVKEKYEDMDEKLCIADLCSGTGCIGITLGNLYKNSEVFCVEYSDEAAKYLSENIKNVAHNGNVIMERGDILDMDFISNLATLKEFDIIISNPPYISHDEKKSLDKGLCYEPEIALFTTDDGLYYYKYMTEPWSERIKTDGSLFYEVGYTQGQAVKEILEDNGFVETEIFTDLAGNDRVVYGKKK